MSKPTVAELMAEIEKLRSDNEALKASGKRGVTLKVTEKGCVGIYGLRRFPIVLFVEEVERVLSMNDELRAFITANAASLSRKQR